MRARTLFLIPALPLLALGITACQTYTPIAITSVEPSKGASDSASESPSESPSPEPEDSPTPSPTSSPDSTPESVAITSLSVGDCILNPGENSGATMERVDCGVSHYGEMFYTGTSGLTDYDETSLTDEIQLACESAMTSYMAPGSTDGYSFKYWYPQATAWAAGNHDYYCVAIKEDETDFTGTLKGGGSDGGSGGGSGGGSETT
ncbi:hypothetical protein [Actinomyces slackii]|uniref:Septum formation-related domain-containing protein n=2 Tax=Actinomyces slackii TaxID=52774 RepID=A0A448K962_9ACTO|nr:hypothetical protein [Actinomyces slackii]VEG73513.1 Uncharacterised protein [Actinomyces slackii]